MVGVVGACVCRFVQPGRPGPGSVPGVTREEDKPAEPVTVEQIGAALAALGLYDGCNTAAEHAAEAARLGGTDAYRVRIVNALLGAVQTQAMLADAVELDEEARHAAWREQLMSAGVWDDPAVRVGFIRSQVLRAARDSLQTAIDNTDILLDMLKSVGL